ncbi:NUDIX hydrolase [Mesorhizobium sp. 1B3]|uniref:NUDIX hydrolase n=1 Tax=Mesorhizobium sp. 1B3 TaxID=3243599 RepID=UPI003D9845E1
MATIRIAAAIIRDGNGNLLLVRKRGTQAFMQAGGKIEPDEQPVNALARELREELGITMAQSTYLGKFSAPAANEPGAEVVAELFEVTADQEPVPAAEIEEMIWFSPGQREDILLAPLTRDIVLTREAGEKQIG